MTETHASWYELTLLSLAKHGSASLAIGLNDLLEVYSLLLKQGLYLNSFLWGHEIAWECDTKAWSSTPWRMLLGLLTVIRGRGREQAYFWTQLVLLFLRSSANPSECISHQEWHNMARKLSSLTISSAQVNSAWEPITAIEGFLKEAAGLKHGDGNVKAPCNTNDMPKLFFVRDIIEVCFDGTWREQLHQELDQQLQVRKSQQEGVLEAV
jgi:hypothetical protein